MHNLVRVFVAFFLTSISPSSHAISIGYTRFEEMAQVAEFIGVVKAENVVGVEAQGKSCGYVVKAQVVEAIKGHRNHIQFYVEKKSDLLDGHDRYFLMAFDIDKESSYREQLDGCGLEDVHYVASSTWQTVFPFGVESDRWVTGSMLLASRESAFSYNAYYAEDEYVDHFVVLDEKIYAAVTWEAVKEKLLALLNEEKPGA